jgi:uncharacterized protein YndB with AHSA1/START domain
MSIAPIVRTVTVKAPPERAFDLFTTRITDWWPRAHSMGPGALVGVVLEPRPGGRWYEVKEDDSEAPFGHVLAWDPPRRLLLAWQINTGFRYDPALVTEVEIRFEAQGSGTLVTLEHRNLERFGGDAASFAAMLDGGWPLTLGSFADFTAQQA